jgi:hypothetical protein
MDPNNPVVKLCAEGMQAEAQGQPGHALELFMRAWSASRDDYDACVAAHYVARHQEGPEATLRWNQEALTRADMVGDERVHGFYPSLYLNMGHSHEVLGNIDEARRYYTMAAAASGTLPDGRYGDVVATGIAEGLKRTGPAAI